jgi:hypothetical protein
LRSGRCWATAMHRREAKMVSPEAKSVLEKMVSKVRQLTKQPWGHARVPNSVQKSEITRARVPPCLLTVYESESEI